jgi:hypothetical protein
LSLVHVTDGSPDPIAIGIAAVVTAILMWRHVNPGILVLVGGTVYALMTR